MRNVFVLAVGFTLLAAGCGGSSGKTSGSSGVSTGQTSGGASSGAGATTGKTTGGSNGNGTTGSSSTGGTGSGGLGAGQPCSADTACASGICGIAGAGKCCAGPSPCLTGDATCGATACDDTGACVYASNSTACGEITCTDGLVTCGSCDGQGSCADGGSVLCAGGLGCADAGETCLLSCESSADCAHGLPCNGGTCKPATPTGPCTENDDCISNNCGGLVDGGSGNCCSATCPAGTDPACDPDACDATSGACLYPAGATCGQAATCFGNQLIAGACSALGVCQVGPTSCPNHFGCNAAHTACNATCAAAADCATGSYCEADAGSCLPQIAAGPCSDNTACTSGICGIAGSGNCCTQACSNTTPPCGAVDCDAITAACTYRDSATACGTVLASCTGSTQQDPSVCDGTGACNTTPGTIDCTPYVCGATACLSTCSDNTSCAATDFCDVANSTCCTGLITGGVIAVDSINGADSTCCGTGTNGPCQTIGQAMILIDAAQALNVTINATVANGAGDWTPQGEVYPIVLGWGVELNAPGVNFNDLNGNPAVIDIAQYSKNDTGGGASLVGSAVSQVVVGFDSLFEQTTDTSAIKVESGQTLYIANALANGNNAGNTTAIIVAAGATLTLGQDQSGAITGTVNIGSPAVPDGWDGIVCKSDATSSEGCTINDAALKGGVSSVVIQKQEDEDFLVGDFGNVTLTSNPVIGLPPAQAGFLQCGQKVDMSFNSGTGAVLLKGSATMTFSNGTVQCIGSQGFELLASANGTPILTLTSTTIQNTEQAIYAKAGKVTVSNSTIQYNYNGVTQDTDGTNIATIDLSGGGVGTNTIVCSNSGESAFGGLGSPGVDVLNNTANVLTADGVDWDTPTPDVFSCGAGNAGCVCQSTTCTSQPNIDDMNAVYESTGLITTTGNGLSAANCTLQGAFCSPFSPCPAWETCCPTGGPQDQCEEGTVCN